MKKKNLAMKMAVLMAGVIAVNTGAQTLVYGEETESAFQETMKAMYENPEMQYKPYARWWLAEGSHTDTTLRESIQELYDAGYGGVEFVTLDESQFLDNETYAWGSDEWIHDTKVIIEECAKLGMSVSMTSGTNWATANLMTIEPDQEAAAQELGYMSVSVEGSEDETEVTSYSGELPKCALPNGATKQTLVKVISAKVTERGTEKDDENFTPTKLDMSSMKDVTELAKDEDGDGVYSIDFAAEDNGEYDLIAFYQYGTGETQSPAVSPSYTINYLSTEGAEAVIDYWDSNVLTEEVQGLIDQIDECDLYMDSLELEPRGKNSTGMLWCKDMLEQFKNRRQYDADELLPFAIATSTRAGAFGSPFVYMYEPAEEEDQAEADNLRRDIYQTQTELYTENSLEVLADWLHSKNMKLRAENSYGRNFEISEPITALDYVETESMEFANESDMYRGQAGAAHLFNKRYSSESGAWVMSNYVYNNNYYRQMFYMQYASGIQKTVTHGYSSEYGPEGRVSWPGYEGMSNVWSDRFNKRQPAALDYPEENVHFSRIQKVLEAGVPQMDVAILRSDYGYNNSVVPGNLMSFVKQGVYTNKSHNQDAYYWRDLELQNNGYTYDYFSPYLLTEESVTSENGLVNADGVAYQALIVMEDEMPYDSAVELLEYAKNGQPIVFVNNVSSMVANPEVLKVNTIAAGTTGSNDGKDEELAKVVAEIKEQDCVRTVDSTEDAMEALQELGVYPRAQYVEENQNLLTVMRKSEEATYLYVYNYMYEDEEHYEGKISVDGAYVPYVLNTWNGDVKKCEQYETDNGRTVLNVDIAPGEVMIFLMDPEGTDGEIAAEESDVAELALSKWSLVVDSYEPGEKLTRTELNEETGIETTEVTYNTTHRMIEVGELEELVSWKDLEAVGEEVSGAGTYYNEPIN
ncbi:MAG: hypothetical protein Q4B26_05835 [Eubacteriales bacterium]|nr:hypothetical protein [Eubacteriales bacterium]